MTDQEINIAVAEACGVPREMIDAWLDYQKAEVQFQCAEIGHEEYYTRHLRRILLWHCPNYCSDLNAVAEARRQILTTQAKICAFLNHLEAALRRKHGTIVGVYAMIDAEAKNQCEAILRTLGKWRD